MSALRLSSGVCAGLCVGVFLLAAAPAAAQIYTWRDANGRLVLSDRPPLDPGQPMSIASHPVYSSETVRTTRPVSPERSARFEPLIQHYARLHGVRPDLVRAVIQVESAFNPAAVSPKGAIGLMQLMPSTAAELGVGNPFDPAENVRGGVLYLRRLLDRYDNNEVLALAAYNAGPGAVDRHGETVPPFRETRSYVSKVREAAGQETTAPRGSRIYKSVEFIDGRPVVRYSDRPPASGE